MAKITGPIEISSVDFGRRRLPIRERIRRWLGVPTLEHIRVIALAEIDADAVYDQSADTARTFAEQRLKRAADRGWAIVSGFREDTGALVGATCRPSLERPRANPCAPEPFTPAQEARIREIIREEIDADRLIDRGGDNRDAYARGIAYDRIRLRSPEAIGYAIEELREAGATIASSDQAQPYE